MKERSNAVRQELVNNLLLNKPYQPAHQDAFTR